MNLHSNCCLGQNTAAKWIRHRADRPPESNLTLQIKTFCSLWSDLYEHVAFVTEEDDSWFYCCCLILVFLGREMGPTLTLRKTPKSWWSPVRELWSLTLAAKRPRLTRGRTSAQLKTTTAPQSPTKLSSGSPVRPLENKIWSVLHIGCMKWMMRCLSLLLLWLAGSPLWSKERNEAVVVQKGVSLVLQCRPPAGLPPPVIFWMDNSGSSAYKHICTLKQQIDPRNLCRCQTSIGSRWTNGCPRL